MCAADMTRILWHFEPRVNMNKSHVTNVKAYLDTLRRIEKLKPCFSVQWFMKDNSLVIGSTKPTTREEDDQALVLAKPIDSTTLETFDTELHIADEDSLEMASELNEHYAAKTTVLVLNMASTFKPGGGVANGAHAQEEDLFRSSNYAHCLAPEFYADNAMERSVIYTPRVTIIKARQGHVLSNPFNVACLAVSAPRRPKVVFDIDGNAQYKILEQEQEMRLKINAIFETAIKMGHKVIVLGALGCGAYGNPVSQVVNMFQEALDKYARYFMCIGFAVLVIGQRGQSNLDAFSTLKINKTTL